MLTHICRGTVTVVNSPRTSCCRLNRAACYSKLECFAECTSDCDFVLSTLHAAEAAAGDASDLYSGKWKSMCLKALMRRSAAYAQNGELSVLCQASLHSA